MIRLREFLKSKQFINVFFILKPKKYLKVLLSCFNIKVKQSTYDVDYVWKTHLNILKLFSNFIQL